MAGYPGAQASFGSMKPIIDLLFKELLSKVPMQVKRAERVK